VLKDIVGLVKRINSLSLNSVIPKKKIKMIVTAGLLLVFEI